MNILDLVTLVAMIFTIGEIGWILGFLMGQNRAYKAINPAKK